MMEYIQSINWNGMIETALPWISQNAFFVILGTAFLLQWVAFQAFVIHFQMFKTKVTRPRQDLKKIRQLERLIEFQSQQMEQVFEKYAALKKEINQVARESMQRSQWQAPQRSESIESNFLSMGEINLKKRLESLKNS